MAWAKKRNSAPGFKELLKQDLQTGEFRSVYVIDGEDQLRIEQVVDAIRKKALDPASAAFNEHLVDVDQVGWVGVIQKAQGFPMLGGRQVVLARRADQIPLKKGDAAEAALVKYLAAPVDSTLLILTGHKFDGRKGWLTAAKKAGYYFHFAAPEGRELETWLDKAASKAGLDLPPAARQVLLQLVGNDLQGLLVEVEKLSLLQESRGTAPTAAEIPELVMDQADLEIFKLTDAFSPGEAASLLRTWLRLASWGTDVYGLTPLLTSHLRRTALAAVSEAEGETASSISSQTHLNSWLLKNKIIPVARRLGTANCQRILTACLACEQAQKRRPVPPELAFEQLLMEASRLD